jgi:hypothetical protein
VKKELFVVEVVLCQETGEDVSVVCAIACWEMYEMRLLIGVAKISVNSKKQITKYNGKINAFTFLALHILD